MKLIKLISKLTIGIIILLYSACNKVFDADIDQESKDYCLFGQDSYWVYQNSTTFETDTVVISDVSYKKTGNLCLWEEYTMITRCFLNSHNNIYYSGSYVLTSQYSDYTNVKYGNIHIQLICRNKIDEIYFDSMYKDYTNYRNGSFRYNYYDGINYENYYENYQVENKAFSKVKVFLSPFSQSYQIRTYWAKNVGIIRTEYIGEDGNTFAVRNLIKYNVKPYKK
jgi:hypothetical protein